MISGWQLSTLVLFYPDNFINKSRRRRSVVSLYSTCLPDRDISNAPQMLFIHTISIYFVSNLVTAICTRYGIRITGIARYARTLYARWIRVRRPNWAMAKSTMQQIRAAKISWREIFLLGVSRILRPKQFSFCQHIRLRFRCRSSSPSQPPY